MRGFTRRRAGLRIVADSESVAIFDDASSHGGYVMAIEVETQAQLDWLILQLQRVRLKEPK